MEAVDAIQVNILDAELGEGCIEGARKVGDVVDNFGLRLSGCSEMKEYM